MGEGHKNATKTVTCQIDDLRLVAGNVICLVSAGLKIRLAGCSGRNSNMDLALRNRFYAATAQRPNSICLFDFDLCTRGLDLFLDLVRLLLGHPFLDGFVLAFYKLLHHREAASLYRT